MKKLGLAIGLGLLPFLTGAATLPLEQVVRKLEANFAATKTYSAKFEQEVRSTQFNKVLTKGSGEL